MCCLLIGLAACSTTEQKQSEAAEVRAGIRDGSLVAVGDDVRVTTVAGEQFDFEVTAITDGELFGDKHTVSIDSITAVEVRRFSPGRTAAAVAVTAGVSWWLVGLLVSSLVFFP
jgi:hypothetical protein